MNFAKQKEKAFVVLATPNPAEVAFKVAVNYTNFAPSQLPDLLSTYSAWSGKDPLKVADWGTYVYTNAESEGDVLWFYFAKAKSAGDIATAFETTYEEEFYSWPTIISSITFRSFTPYPVFGNDQWYITQDGYDPYDGLTKIKIEKFLSNSPFAVTASLSPQPSPIWWNFGRREIGSTVSALHPQIIVPPTYFDAAGPTYATRDFYTHAGDYGDPPSGGPSPVAITKIPAVTFAATAATTWADHVVRSKTTKVNGVYYWEKHTAIAPASAGPVVRKILSLTTADSGISV